MATSRIPRGRVAVAASVLGAVIGVGAWKSVTQSRDGSSASLLGRRPTVRLDHDVKQQNSSSTGKSALPIAGHENHPLERQKNVRQVSRWVPPSRDETLRHMMADPATNEYDLLVVGGGATGCGVAVDAAARGLRVALVERDDFSSGTSSRSTKLVHGGVRYLEKAFWDLDIEQYKLVQEALAERHTVLKIAPYLATQLPIMCPIYRWWQVPYYWAGCKAYDLVAAGRGLQSSYFLSKSKALEQFPMLQADNLCGAVVYYDGQQNDSRMNVALALTANFYGADVANHVEVTGLLKSSEDGTSQPGKIVGATLRDAITGKEWSIKAKGVINATGPFTDSLRKMDEPSCQNIIAPSAGTHIVLPHYFSPEHMGLIDPCTSDGRVIFFIPWEGNTVAGTTDAPSPITYDPVPSEAEIEFILKEVSHYLSPDIKVRRGDVLAAWAGIRPLVRNPAAKDTASLVRNHLVYISDSGLLTVAGGKWTTYRKMAEEAVDMAIEKFDLTPMSACCTEELLLMGTHGYRAQDYIHLIQQYGLETEVAQHLLHNYGDRALAIAAMAGTTGARWPVMGVRLSYSYNFIEAEVKHAVRREYACTAVDVLARRTRLAFLNAQAALEALPRVVELMAAELGWSAARCAQETETAKQFLMTMGLVVGRSRASFKSDEMARLRDAFARADRDNDGMVPVADIVPLLKTVVPAVPDEQQIQRLLKDNDDVTRDGVDFNDFLRLVSAAQETEKRG